MTISEFLNHLHKLGIDIKADGDKLHLQAPKGVISAPLQQEITTRKPAILDYFKAITNQTSSTRSSSIPSISREGFVPLSYSQESFWFVSQLEPDSPIFNIPLFFTVNGPLNVQALEESLNEIVKRHEILRATCTTTDGKPAIHITGKLTIPLETIDLRSLAGSQQNSAVHRLAQNVANRPFDFTSEPSLRATLLWLDSEEYVLLLALHHFIADGWAISIFSQELSSLYKAFSTNKPSPLPLLPIQYVDFAHYQKERVDSGSLDSQLAYWKNSLDGFQSLELPTDHPRLAVQRYSGATHHFALSTTLSNSLRSFSSEQGVTLFITLLSAFKTLLQRYTQQDDILLATAVSNRTHAELEGLMGSFANNLLLRTRIKKKTTFRELLQQVQKVMKEALNHQDYPFERLFDSLVNKQELHNNPLLRGMFILHQKAPTQILNLDNLSLRELEFDTKTSLFDMSLSMVNKSGKLTGSLTYSTDLFESSTIERMLGHFQILLEGIVANPDTPISDLPLLTKEERHQLLVKWNDTSIDYPRDKCVHQLFEEQVKNTPNAIALVFGKEQITYREFNARANQLANHLRTLGAGPNVLIGICVERSIEMIVGILAILKAGGAYVPIDPNLPKERISFILEDAQISVLLTEQQWISNLPHSHLTLVCLDSQITAVSEKNQVSPIHLGSSSDLAYVIYTSGSTGAPKGAKITHKNLCNYIHWSKVNGLIEQSDRVLQRTILSFDVASNEILAPLLTGATLVIASPESQQDLNILSQQVIQNEITRLHLPPSALRLLVQDSSFTKTNYLRQIISGGEELDIDLRNRILENLDIILLNGYGPTETTITATFHQCKLTDTGKTVSIGRPLGNTQIYLLDSFQQLVPAGHIGELCIAGDCVGNGYLNKPELTAEKFVSNPFGEGTLYKTGDLARYQPDGSIEYLGRKDYQVKIRGFRIELGEVENALNSLPEVKEAVVMVRENENADKQLIAYVVGDTTQKLRADLATKLPSHMLPSFYVQLDSLPLLPNGKIDRHAFPEFDINKLTVDEPFVAPRSIVEKQLADIWIELLDFDRVGIHNNFFELGGHSLKAMQVISRIRDTFQIELPLRDLFETPTIARLAQQIDTVLWLTQPDMRTVETAALGEEGLL